MNYIANLCERYLKEIQLKKIQKLVFIFTQKYTRMRVLRKQHLSHLIKIVSCLLAHHIVIAVSQTNNFSLLVVSQ